jgi:5-methylcytosine-specific restriction enzyme A
MSPSTTPARVSTAVALVTDPFYLTKAWRRLREERLRLDGYVCVVPGCGQRATVVDHVVSRRAGGANILSNLRSLCREHDDQVKERPGGIRANKGKLIARGCHHDGSPRDPNHPWFKS